MIQRIVKEFRFESAHRLPNLPATHKCSRLHGHSFRFEVHVEGPLDPVLGWVMDFAEVSKVVKPLLEELDHYYLNDIAGLENPTSEVIASWLWQRLKPQLPLLVKLVLHETCTARCEYEGK